MNFQHSEKGNGEGKMEREQKIMEPKSALVIAIRFLLLKKLVKICSNGRKYLFFLKPKIAGGDRNVSHPYCRGPQPFWLYGPLAGLAVAAVGGGQQWFHARSLDPVHAQRKLCTLTHPLCGLVPNRPWTGTDPGTGRWGPLSLLYFHFDFKLLKHLDRTLRSFFFL